MLNAHLEVAVPPESRFVVELWEGRDEVDAHALLSRIERHPRWALWDISIDAVGRELPPRPTYAQIMSAAYLAYAHARGRARWGDKTPRYVEHISLLARLWPDARFVHLIRDGRDVALSYADVPFGPKSVSRAADLWARRVRAGVSAGRALGPRRYLETHYEHFVADPERHARILCGFLDLPFDPGMLDRGERSQEVILPRAARLNPHVAERPREKLRSWRKEMSRAHVEVFEAAAGDVLAELGYERRYDSPRARARAAAALGRLGFPIGRLRRSRPRRGS
jgi:hypothetical protein